MVVATVFGTIISMATLAVAVVQIYGTSNGAASATSERVRRSLSVMTPALTWKAITHFSKEAATEERMIALILITTILSLGALTFLPIFVLLLVRRPIPPREPDVLPPSVAKTEYERKASSHYGDGKDIVEQCYHKSDLERCYRVSIEDTDEEDWFRFQANPVDQLSEALRHDSWAAEPSNELASRGIAQKLSGSRYEGMIHVVEVCDKPRRVEEFKLVDTNITAKRVLELGVPALRRRIKKREELLRKDDSDSDRD